tara:strand:- start:11 stop:526 length:516 start_codon:yes stop_codon:yes gene_type:complete
MKKFLNRYPVKVKKLYFKIGKNFITENVNFFMKRHNVHGGIQILPTDFKLIKKRMYRYTHFNIQYTVHKPGKKYILLKILKRGYFDGKIYKQPIYDGNSFILTKCLSAQNNIDYVNLKKKVFKHSLSNIKNVKALKKAIKRRYKKSLAHLSDLEKLSLGIAVTELKIIKRF